MDVPEQSRDSIADAWGPRTPHRGDWPIHEDLRVLWAPERWIRSIEPRIVASNMTGPGALFRYVRTHRTSQSERRSPGDSHVRRALLRGAP